MKCLFTKMETLGMMIQQPHLDLGTQPVLHLSLGLIFSEKSNTAVCVAQVVDTTK